MAESGRVTSELRESRKDPKPPQRSRFLGMMGLLMLIPFVLYTLYTVTDKFVQTYRLRQQGAIARAELEAERDENFRLQRELVNARSDEEIERSARINLNLIKPGDQAIVLVGAAPTVTPTPPARVVQSTHDDMPDWLKWVLDQLNM